MKTKLFLFYLRLKKPIILIFGLLAFGITAVNQWLEYKAKNINTSPWITKNILSGNQFIAIRGDETATISLCGVKTQGQESRDYLQRVINLGDGTVQLEKVENGFEAWILINEDYDVELVRHVSSQPNYLVGETIHLNTWMIERGFARHDEQNSGRCKQPENLVWAENIAKQKKLNVWSELD